MTDGRAAVVVVNFGSSKLLETNAARIPVSADVIVIIVDCFSGAQERATVEEICNRYGWNAVLLNHNAGFGGGMNAGVEAAANAGAQVIVALNPDASLTVDSLSALVEESAASPRALVSPRVQASDGSSWFSGSDLYLDDGSIAGRVRRRERVGRPRHEWATGACFAMTMELWRAIGGIDEDYFLYWEDVDLSRRVLDAGGELRLADVLAIHDEGQTHTDAAQDARQKSETYYYFNIRNRRVYASRHLDREGVRRWLKATPRISFQIVLQGGKKQLITSVEPWRALLRGVRDGRRIALQALKR